MSIKGVKAKDGTETVQHPLTLKNGLYCVFKYPGVDIESMSVSVGIFKFKGF